MKKENDFALKKNRLTVDVINLNIQQLKNAYHDTNIIIPSNNMNRLSEHVVNDSHRTAVQHLNQFSAPVLTQEERERGRKKVEEVLEKRRRRLEGN